MIPHSFIKKTQVMNSKSTLLYIISALIFCIAGVLLYLFFITASTEILSYLALAVGLVLFAVYLLYKGRFPKKKEKHIRYF
jgi:Flp pilus assembly protein TadB